MNDYDKAGRYLVKKDPSGFFRWFLNKLAVIFLAWLDARRVALPNQRDLTNDLVAALQMGQCVEGACVELEAEAKSKAVDRSLSYLARFWTEPGTTESMPLRCVFGAILDLTDRSKARELSLQSMIVPGCRLELTVFRRHLADEDAGPMLARVVAGEVSVWQLGWLPLMQSGGDSIIIKQWRQVVETRLADPLDQADLATLCLTFATLADCRPAWQRGLRGWNVKTSPFLDEIRAEERKEALADGRVEGMQTLLLSLGRQKFGKGATKQQQRELAAIADVAELENLAQRLLAVNSWTD